MYEASEIGRAGEQAVVAWLQTNGCRVTRWDTAGPGSTDVEAHGKESYLVQVKSAVAPNAPGTMSAAEERNIKARALRSGRVAYLARVTLDANLTAVGEIVWKRLTN